MAFLRYARAGVITPDVKGNHWDKVRVASSAKVNSSLRKQAEEILGEAFTPDRFLLTHATIVCSVDAISPPGTKTGSLTQDGQAILRKYAEFRVDPKTDSFINNNLDCWSREVIKKSYKTFVGAHNFVEHVQVEELSKGRVIDAVLRDIGDSLYVDILVATDRKHESLVEGILSGKTNAMSMGCSVDFTICTKCGHVAADETEMCQHVKYEKGNAFYDEQGNKHRVAELCGHHSSGETGGVTFIEASWVETPAFKGAVARNILEIPSSDSSDVPEKWIQKSASHRLAFGFGDEEDNEGGQEEAPKVKDTKAILEELETSVTDAIMERIKKKIDKELIKSLLIDNVGSPSISDSTVRENDTIVKEGHLLRKIYARNIESAIRIAKNDSEVVDNIRLVNDHYNVRMSDEIYRIAKLLGRADRYASVEAFLQRATMYNGGYLSEQDKSRLVRLAKLISTRA